VLAQSRCSKPSLGRPPCMSLLDDLKNQAEVLRKRQQSGSALHDHYFREIHERLKAIYQHLNELANSLNTIRPEVIRYFYIEPSSVLEDLRQADYSISAKHQQPVRTAARIRPVRDEPEPESPMVETPPEDDAPKSLFGSLKSLLKRKAD
jgi:hypothetical protein